MKTLFVIAQCIRLLHTDPWTSSTYRIKEVGAYSYNVEAVYAVLYRNNQGTPSILPLDDGKGFIIFKNQRKYEEVDCATAVPTLNEISP